MDPPSPSPPASGSAEPLLAPRPSRRTVATLVALVAVAATLRFVHLAAGLPDVVEVDAFKFVRPALAIAAGETPPRDFQYPELYPRLVALLLSPTSDETAAHLAARVVAALAGVALVPVTFLAARRLADGAGVGLLAAALVAVSPAMVTLSRSAATDSLLVLAMTAGLAVALDPAFAEGRLGRSTAGGLALGAAISAKWTGIVLAPVLAVPLGLLLWRRRVRPALLGGTVVALVATGTLVLTTPAVVTHGAVYLARFRHDVVIVRHGQIGRVQEGWTDFLIGDTPTWEQPWLGTSLLADGGPLVLVAGLAGLGLALAGRRGFPGVLHGLVVVGYAAAVVGPGRILAMRFLLPLLPSFLALAAVAVDWTSARLGRRRGLFAALAAILVAVPLARSVSSGVFVRGEPTTVALARDFLAERVAPGEGVFLAPFFLRPLAAGLARPLGLGPVASRQYRFPQRPQENGELSPIYGPGLVGSLRAEGARWVVSAAPFDEAFSPIPANRRWFPASTAAYAAWRAELAAAAEPVATFEGLPEAPRRGPKIEIWRLRVEP